MGAWQEETELRSGSRHGSPASCLLLPGFPSQSQATAPPPGSLSRFSLPTFLSSQPGIEDPFPSLTYQNPACFLRPRSRCRCLAVWLCFSWSSSNLPHVLLRCLCLCAPLVLEWWGQNHGLILLCPSTQPVPRTLRAQGWLLISKQLFEVGQWGGPPLSKHFPLLITYLIPFPSSFPESPSHASVPFLKEECQQMLKTWGPSSDGYGQNQ